MTADALVAGLRAGDDAAISELVRAHRSNVFQLALRYVRNREDAEEIAQDVFLSAVRNITQFRGDAALSSWLYRITFNHAMSFLRTRRFARRMEREAEHLAVAAPLFDWPDEACRRPDRLLLSREIAEHVREAVDELPHIYQSAAVGLAINRDPVRSVAERLGVTEGTLKSRTHRARVLLRERLSGLVPERYV